MDPEEQVAGPRWKGGDTFVIPALLFAAFAFPQVWPGAPSSVLAPSSMARSP